jgi:phage tail sheath protein FI
LISNFFTSVWRNEALKGATVDEAFFVQCDLKIMTQSDIDNGLLILEVGVATVKPVEFLIITDWAKNCGR